MPGLLVVERKIISSVLPVRLKDVDAKGGTVCSYASSFDVVDDNYPIPDMVVRSAFKKTIIENGPQGANRILFLWDHNKDMILGKPAVLKEDDFGLYGETRVIRTSYGADVLLLYEEKIINEHSIGYWVVESDYGEVRGEKVRILRQLALLEYSAVPWGMNPITPTVGLKGNQGAIERLADQLGRIQGVLHNAHFQSDNFAPHLQRRADELELLLKAVQPPEPAHERITTTQEGTPMTLDEIKALVAAGVREALEAKDATGKTTWPLADRDTAWDGGEAHNNIVAWATKADGTYDEGKLESVHFYSPGGAGGQKLGGYKLLFCNVDDKGKVQAIPNAIIACYGSHGVDATKGIEESDKDAIKKKISTYCAKMRKEFDNPDGFVPSWEQSDSEKRRQRPMRRKDFNYLLARGDYRAHLTQQLAASRKDFQGALVSEDLQQIWADAWNALALSLLRDMCDAVWGPIGGGEKPDAKETVGADFDQAKAYFVELAAKSVAAGFVPCGDDDGDGFYNPAACDDDNDYGMMSARSTLATKEGRKMSAANHKALSASLAKIAEGHAEAKSLMAKMKPSNADDGEADTSDNSPDNDNDAKGAKGAQPGAGAEPHTTGEEPAGAPEPTTPANESISAWFSQFANQFRSVTGDQHNGHHQGT